jgi:hypothetical protein
LFSVNNKCSFTNKTFPV